jgi:NAD(P)-dependent dehydrogenase (short-subunit alcohol dehydrogenase family)
MKKNFWFNLENKVILITGGAGLFGKEHAKSVISCGATAVIADINYHAAAQVAKDLGKSAYALELDITSDQSIQNSLKTLIKEFTRVDVLINNAAIDPKVGEIGLVGSRLENYSFAALLDELKVNLVGAIAVSRTYGEYFAANKGGVILNISSDLGLISPDQRLYEVENVDEFSQPVKPVSYSVAKAGLIGLTKYLSTYWANKNVRVNAICPGGIEAGQDEIFLKKIAKRIPLGRLAKPGEYQALVAYLCSEESSYVTGAVISADGGRTAW